MSQPTITKTKNKKRGPLDWIESIGNRLPDPTTLFIIGAVLVMIISHIAAVGEWQVVKLDAVMVDGEMTLRPATKSITETIDGETVTSEVPDAFTAKSLLTADGLFFAISTMVDNFMDFPPLGVVLVGMLGIGVCERVGLIAALLRATMRVVPNSALTPAMVFLGIMSSMTLDAGYVVLPPLAALLYHAAGRSPLAGLAAVFAGVAAGFNANLLPTGLDPMLANFTKVGADVVHPGYNVNPLCNYYFMIASTLVMTGVGWGVNAWLIEPRLRGKSPEEGGPPSAPDATAAESSADPKEADGLRWSMAGLGAVLAIFAILTLVPDMPLHGDGKNFPRWVEAIVPMLFLAFLVPGLIYGARVGAIRDDRDAAKLMTDALAAMAPIIVLAFFAAQFIAYFSYSGLDKMLALAGAQALGQANLGKGALLVMFIGVTFIFNLFIGSMSAKYAMFAPIFVPMFMLLGVSPELTQAAYRVGDSVSNIITPLNSYVIIILVFVQKYMPKAGIGTLIATMLPYSIAMGIVWTIMLLIWVGLGIPLGPDGGLVYTPEPQL